MKRLTCALLLLCSHTVLAEITPNEDVSSIRAFQANSSQLITSGLPTEHQFQSLAVSGVDVVINLMPDSSNTEYQNEAELVKQAGMQYFYIPVDWKNPTQADLQTFFEVMDANKDKDILLHCLANYRASAFAYLYQLKQGNKVEMSEVMTPWGGDLTKYPQWQKLIEDYQATLN